MCFGEAVKVAVFELVLIHTVQNESVLNVGHHDFAAADAGNQVALPCEQSVYRFFAHKGSKQAVAKRRHTAAHNVRKARKFGFNTRFRFDFLGQIGGVFLAHALANQNKEIALAHFLVFADLFDERILIKGHFGNGSSSGANGNRTLQGNVACVSAHNLNNRASCVRFAGIS